MTECRSSEVILNTLRHAPLLVGDVGDVLKFDRRYLNYGPSPYTLDFDQKLGHLYEDALAELISNSATLELIARNLQIFYAIGRTLGELDYVVYDRVSKNQIHIELAVKFYLGVLQKGTWHFPGPDPRDNWHRKLERMRTHQFQLAKTSEARAYLHEKFGIETIETQQLIYGRLFDPIDCADRSQLPAMAADALRGRWLYVRDWQKYFPDEPEIRVIPKQLWPVELSHEAWALFEPISVKNLLQIATERCTLFTTADADEPTFLVPDTWSAYV